MDPNAAWKELGLILVLLAAQVEDSEESETEERYNREEETKRAYALFHYLDNWLADNGLPSILWQQLANRRKAVTKK